MVWLGYAPNESRCSRDCICSKWTNAGEISFSPEGDLLDRGIRMADLKINARKSVLDRLPKSLGPSDQLTFGGLRNDV